MNLEINNACTIATEECQRRAACRAVDDSINEKTRVVGIGGSKAAFYATERIIERYNQEDTLSHLVFVPNSNNAMHTLVKYDLPGGDLNRYPDIDVGFDGVDELDYNLHAIKGNEGSLLQEKLVATSTKNFIVIGDYGQLSDRLGQQYCGGIPIEVVKATFKPTINHLQAVLGGEVRLCMGQAKRGPLVSDNNFYMLEWMVNPRQKYNWIVAHDAIKATTGVAECGIWVNDISQAYIGMANGTVKQIKKNRVCISF